MTPQEKATDLVRKLYHSITGAQQAKSFDIAMYKTSKEFIRATQCAIICVEEIIEEAKRIVGSPEFTTEYEKKTIDYWQSVLTILKTKP